MSARYRFGRYVLDANARVLTAQGEPLAVGARAFDTLLVLVQRAPGVVTKAELLESVWRGLVVEENNLEVQVSTLRKLLGRESVVTVHGHGYRFGPQLIEAGDDGAASKTNIPLPRSTLYGRRNDIERASALLRTHRLVTLIGPGGIGKTQLALCVARDLLPNFADGAWVVEFAPLADGRLVTRAAASVLGVVEGYDSASLEAIALSLQAKSLLLVVDNCEHLLSAVATLVEALLGKCAGLHVLATSREPLRLESEAVYDLDPLATPPQDSIEASSASEFPAVQLFVDRATAARSTFVLNQTNVRSVASVCTQLDGIPLAIELAAACLRSMSVDEIAKRLTHRFELLVSGKRGALPRQQTLRGLIDWSYELLDEEERLLFNRLSVFAGGWTLDAATKVCGDNADEWHVLRLMTSLVTKSVVVATETAQGTRYRYLETIRQYAEERLEASGEATARARLHLDYFVDLAENSEGSFYSEHQLAWFDRIEADHDNYRRALARATGTPSSGSALRLAGALWRFWATRGYVSEGRKHLAAALARDDGTADDRWRALHGAGNLARSQGDYDDARASHEAALALATAMGDDGGIAPCLVSLGIIAREEMDLVAAREYFTRALSIQTKRDDPWGRAMSLSGLASVSNDQGDRENAILLQEQSLALWRELSDRLNMAGSLNALGSYAYDRGDYETARAHLEQGLALRRELGHRSGIAASLNNLAVLADHDGDVDQAEAMLQECLAIQREMSDWRGVSWSLTNLGFSANKRGHRTTASHLFSQSLDIQARLGLRGTIALSLQGVAQLAADCHSPIVGATLIGTADRVRTDLGLLLNLRNRSEHEALTRRLRTLLGDAVFDLAWKEGAGMPLDEAVAFAQTRLLRQQAISSPSGAVGW